MPSVGKLCNISQPPQEVQSLKIKFLLVGLGSRGDCHGQEDKDLSPVGLRGRVWCSAEGVWLVLGYGLALWIRVWCRAGVRVRVKASILMLGIKARN